MSQFPDPLFIVNLNKAVKGVFSVVMALMNEGHNMTHHHSAH